MRTSTVSVGAWLAALAMSAYPAAAAADPPAAEVQFRIAQRLAADGSPDAAAAFEKTLALAPAGPLADDALVGLARVQGAVEWPEDLPRLDVSRASAAASTLGKVLASFPDGDRIAEARYLLALVRAAPVPGRDPAASREDLIAIAGSKGGGRWAAAARYALGVLAERDGALSRAAGAYARVVIESPDDSAASRARVGFARALMAAERFGDAATWLQAAIESGAAPSLRAEPLRELAVREIVRARDPSRRWSAVAAPLASTTTTRGASLLAATQDGGILVFDRKNAALQAFDARGSGSPPVAQDAVTAMATDPYGRVFAVAGDRLLRWDGKDATLAGTLGPFAEASGLAVDASGAAWVADRRGDRVGRLAPGAGAPVTVREAKGAGVSALAIVGGHVIVAEERTGRLVALSGDGPERTFGPAFRKPVALAVDAVGRLSVLDAKAETLTRLSPSGEVRDTLSLPAAGVSRGLALAVAADGAVSILDGSTGAAVVAP